MRKSYYFIVSALTILMIVSCEKDDKVSQPPTIQDMIGDWELADDSYTGTLSFGSGNGGYEGFVDGTKSGWANYKWTLDGNTLTMTYDFMTGDFASYNSMSLNTPQTSTITLSGDQLTLKYNGTDYIYKKVNTDNSILRGSWELTNGSYNGILTFDTVNYIDGYDAFNDDTIIGAANFSWWLKGNILTMNYNGQMIGSYESYNEIALNSTVMSVIDVSGNQLTITNNGTPYVYNKTTSIGKELEGTTWKIVDGDYNGIISFNSYSDGEDSFIDMDESGYSGFLWMLSGNKLVLMYSRGLGDYASYNEVSEEEVIVSNLILSDNQLIFNYDGVDYTYSRMTSDVVVDGSEINGKWLMTDGDYIDTLNFDYKPNTVPVRGKDSFSTTTQSGTAEFTWFINGNMLFIYYFMSNFTGDYESYNDISDDDFITSLANISGNQMTINHEGVDYIYTKLE